MIKAQMKYPSKDDNSSRVDKGNKENHCDPLVNSIQMLEFAQVALEREVHKFGEIGKGIRSLCDSTENTSINVHSNTSINVHSNNNVQTLERWLSKAEARLKEKEFRFVELEAMINNMESLRQDIGNAIELQSERCQEMEAELDSLFTQKVEAEVEYVVITTSTMELSILVKHQIKLLREQQSLAREQVHCRQAGGEEVLKMQRRLSKLAKGLCIQVILLVPVFGLFAVQLLPRSAVVVPT